MKYLLPATSTSPHRCGRLMKLWQIRYREIEKETDGLLNEIVGEVK